MGHAQAPQPSWKQGPFTASQGPDQLHQETGNCGSQGGVLEGVARLCMQVPTLRGSPAAQTIGLLATHTSWAAPQQQDPSSAPVFTGGLHGTLWNKSQSTHQPHPMTWMAVPPTFISFLASTGPACTVSNLNLIRSPNSTATGPPSEGTRAAQPPLGPSILPPLLSLPAALLSVLPKRPAPSGCLPLPAGPTPAVPGGLFPAYGPTIRFSRRAGSAPGPRTSVPQIREDTVSVAVQLPEDPAGNRQHTSTPYCPGPRMLATPVSHGLNMAAQVGSEGTAELKHHP